MAGRSVTVCGLHPVTGKLNQHKFHITQAWVQVIAVDGIRLPAAINLNPELERKLQRMSYCSEDPTKPFDILVDGTWYAARSVSCATNA